MYSQKMIIFMCIVLVLLMAYLRRHPTPKKVSEPASTSKLMPDESARLKQEEIERLQGDFRAQTDNLSQQQLPASDYISDTSVANPDITGSSVDIASSAPQFQPQQPDLAYSPPVMVTQPAQPAQQADDIRRQQEDLRRQQEMLKQQSKRY